jgi:hypothetical protein
LAGPQTVPTSPASPEPAGVTLLDLAALVAGVALVLALPWFYRPHPLADLGPWPRWLPRVQLVRQLLEVAGLALVPVVIARRAAYGGLARPAEFLAACCGLPALAWGVEWLMVRAYVFRRSGLFIPLTTNFGLPGTEVNEWRNGPHQDWMLALFVTGLLASALWVLVRRRWPGCAVTALLMLAWIGLYEAGPTYVSRWVDVSLRWAMSVERIGVTAGYLIGFTVREFPRALIYAVPARVALRDVRRSAPRLTWLERAGVGLAVVLFPVSEVIRHVLLASTSGGGSWLPSSINHVLGVLVAAAVAFAVSKRLSAAWSRMAAVGFDKGRASAPPPV